MADDRPLYDKVKGGGAPLDGELGEGNERKFRVRVEEEVVKPFPCKPETDDECRSELLHLMGVSGYPRIYVLGCFARYVPVGCDR
jgi:hypothetical protein